VKTLDGLIAIPCAIQGRWTSFWMSHEALELPPGVQTRIGRGRSPAENRNGLIEIAQAHGCRWIWFLDDDLVLPPDALLRLLPHLEREDVDAVVPLSFNRGQPFEALWFAANEFEQAKTFGLMTQLPPPGPLVPLAACTFGGLLVKMSAIARMPKPYVTIGQYHPERWNDDVWFCRHLTEAGGRIWGDASVRLGHTTDTELWPHYSPEHGWSVVFAQASQPFLMQPWGESEPEPAGVAR
jgi:glycosyltransferase involved in cell wall biosynthesis